MKLGPVDFAPLTIEQLVRFVKGLSKINNVSIIKVWDKITFIMFVMFVQ